MKLYQYTDNDLTALANQIKDIILDNMAREGMLTLTQTHEYLSTHFVTVTEKKTLFPWLKQKSNPLMIFVSKLPYKVKEEKEDTEDES